MLLENVDLMGCLGLRVLDRIATGLPVVEVPVLPTTDGRGGSDGTNKHAFKNAERSMGRIGLGVLDRIASQPDLC
jgi:hypothetical protein